MATLEDLMRHVEANPADHNERWRLAKKLYSACEYRQAMEHLRLLKRDWKRRQNVCRYLAATYYRLGRYDDAIAELEYSIREWPEELGLREQIARVYEIAGRRDEAGSVWQGILLMNPKHPMAERALERLQRAPEETPEDDLRLLESDSGIDLAPVIICPACGAQNSEEFERCWQCHGALRDTPASARLSFEDKSDPSSDRLTRVLTGLLGVVAAASAAYFTLRFGFPALTAGANGVAADSISTAVQFGFAKPRLAAGVALAIGWPLVMILSLKLVRLKLFPEGQPWKLALTLAGLAYAALWLPLAIVPYALIAVAIAALALTWLVFPLSPAKSLLAGGLHTVAALAIAAGALLLIGGPEPFRDFTAITQALRSAPPATPSTAEHSATTDLVLPIQFESTGSEWLDGVVGTVSFDVEAQVTEPRLSVQLWDTNLVELVDIGTNPNVTLTARITPDRNYELRIKGKPDVPVTVRPRSVLRYKELP